MRRFFFSAMALFLTLPLFGKDYHYPELLVQPPASERLRSLAIGEQKRHFYEPSLLQASALTTFVTGVLQFSNTDLQDDPEEYSPLVGTIVGAGWLAFNFLTSTFSNHYKSAYIKTKDIKGSSDALRLQRERIAEEAIYERASFMRKVTWISFGSQFLTNIYMASNAEPDSISEIAPIFAAAVSVLPLLFQHDSIRQAENHRKYKKKIYRPLVSVVPVYNPVTQSLDTGIRLGWSF